MKAIVRTTTVLAFMFVAATGLANENRNGTKGSEVEHLTKKETTRPVFKKKGDVLYMNLLNLDLEKVKIRVYDSNYRLVFGEVIKGELVIQKAFNFEKAYEDNYTVVIKDSEGTYKENLEVK
ncbi:MAG: hypothetical protein KJO20_03865 [Eudoraea sp.]|nr:hypothetical protein [Eudoraea sp.]